MTDERHKKVADQYDRGYDYTQYWTHRNYEHAAEEAALRRLLAGRRFARAADVGGGFGRLCLLLREYADHVTLAEPSKTQLEAAEKVAPEGGLTDDEALFGPESRLALDSLDALQVSMAIQTRYGLRMPDSKDTRRALTSIAHLATHLAANGKA